MNIHHAVLYGNIADRLKTLRRKRGLTQGTLAERAGVARTTIANIEAGRQHPPLHLVYILCSVLDTEPMKLLPSLREVATAEPIEYEIDGETHPVTPKALQFLATIDD